MKLVAAYVIAAIITAHVFTPVAFKVAERMLDQEIAITMIHE